MTSSLSKNLTESSLVKNEINGDIIDYRAYAKNHKKSRQLKKYPVIDRSFAHANGSAEFAENSLTLPIHGNFLFLHMLKLF